MLTNPVTNDVAETVPPADMSGDSYRLHCFKTVPLSQNTIDTDCPFIAEHVSSALIIEENLPIVKQEPENVCFNSLLHV